MDIDAASTVLVADASNAETRLDDEDYDWDAKQSLLTESDLADELVNSKPKHGTEVFIGAVHLDASESEFVEALRRCGAEHGALSAKLMIDAASGKHRGYAFAIYDTETNALKAIENISTHEVELKSQKIRASLKPSKIRMKISGLRRDATRGEIIDAIREAGAGLEFFSLAKGKDKSLGKSLHAGFGFASYFNEACAERAMKKLRENNGAIVEKVAVTDGRSVDRLTIEWAAVKKPDSRTLFVSDLNDANNSDEGLRESFSRFGDIEEIRVINHDRLKRPVAFVSFVKSESASAAIGECEAAEDDSAKEKGGSFISSVDGSTLHIEIARKNSSKPSGVRRGVGSTSQPSAQRDDWAKHRPAGSSYGGYGGGLAPRSWSGAGGRSAGVQNATPVILPTGQVAYMMGGQGGPRRDGGNRGRRDGGRGGRGGGSRHRPY
jgi:heterogeneous nuclear ribonucleoprotein R